MLSLSPRLPGVIGGYAPNVTHERSPDRMLPWAYCWSTTGARMLLKGYASAGAIDNGFPAEVGGTGADMTRDAAGPTLDVLTALAGPVVTTTATHALRTADGALTVALPYSIVAAFKMVGNISLGGTYVGGKDTTEKIGWLSFLNVLTFVAGGSGASTSLASNTSLTVVLTLDITSTTDRCWSGTTDVGSGSVGNNTPTSIGIGANRDLSQLCATQCSFVGVTSGQLASAHPRWAELVKILGRGS